MDGTKEVTIVACKFLLLSLKGGLSFQLIIFEISSENIIVGFNYSQVSELLSFFKSFNEIELFELQNSFC